MGQPRTFPLLATVMMLCGVAVLLALGTWQLDRLEWKEALLSEIKAQSEIAPRAFSPADLNIENVFQTGSINGRFINEATIQLVPRTYDGASGAHIITPFKTQRGEVILINRGWVKTGEDYVLNTPRTTTGMLREPPRPNMFTPTNDSKSAERYSVNYDEFKTTHNIDITAPVMLYEGCNDEANAAAPNPCALTLNINNNHMQYAFFWFAMAGVLIVIYMLRFWIIKPRD